MSAITITVALEIILSIILISIGFIDSNTFVILIFIAVGLMSIDIEINKKNRH